MSTSVALCVIIRDGAQRCYFDTWMSLHRELIWGPDAFEDWISSGEELDWEPEDLSGIAVLDFDTKHLRWSEQDSFKVQKVERLYWDMMQRSWSGWTFEYLSDGAMTALASQVFSGEESDELHQEEHSGDYRPETVTKAAYRSFDEDEFDDDDASLDPDDDESPRAWVTLIDQNGRARQRVLFELSADLLSPDKAALQTLAEMDASVIPPEVAVHEGFWVDLKNSKVGYWATRQKQNTFEQIRKGWKKWEVSWCDNGYEKQCELSGRAGRTLAVDEALMEFLPLLISARRMDLANIAGALGGALKKTAGTAVGCLVFAISVPILITGFFLEKLMESVYAVVTVAVLAFISFKWLEFRFRRKFEASEVTQKYQTDPDRPPVAGPLDEGERRNFVSELLAAANLPSLSSMEDRLSKELSELDPF